MVSKYALGLDLEPKGGQALVETHGVAMHTLGDRPEPTGAMEHGVHRRDDGEQHLRRADVRRRLLAADMLLARLQGQAIGAVAPGVDGHADEPAGQRALVGVAGGHVGGMRTAVAHRHTVALHGADGDIGAHFAGWLQQRQRQRIGSDGCDGARRVQRRDRREKS